MLYYICNKLVDQNVEFLLIMFVLIIDKLIGEYDGFIYTYTRNGF